MKRSGPPERRARLRRVKPLRQRSERKATENRVVAVPVVDEVFHRDGHRCILAPPRTSAGLTAVGLLAAAGPCLGRLTPHHLRKQRQGGAWVAVNIVTLCEHHNGWVERRPTAAAALGLVIRTGETYAGAWALMRAAGLGVGRQRDPATGRAL